MSIRSFLFCILLIFAFNNIKSQVVINEFFADNVTINPEMKDFDDYSDWIELYNRSENTVDLSGYYLTDNLSNPNKWPIPFGTKIAAKGYLVIWADGYNTGTGVNFIHEYWPWEYFDTRNYHSNFKLSSLGEEIGLFKSGNINYEQIITKGDSWRYLDNGSDQNELWRNPVFDDNNWKVGKAKFGYGDNDETTTIGYGPDSGNKYVTTYFRKTFELANAAEYDSISINLLVDDGCAIYINGDEVLRTNMSSGTLNYQSYASSAIGGNNESSFSNYIIPNKYLLDGENSIAVEVHQNSGNSSDLGFDLEMLTYSSQDISSSVLIDSVVFKRQSSDISFGRTNENSDNWSYFGEPTPGSANNTYSTDQIKYSGVVEFSLESGFYNSVQTLNLSSENEDIFYTKDGSVPTVNSEPYLEPIIIDKNCVVRARTITSGLIDGPVKSKTYFISQEKFTLPVISFIADPFLLWDDDIGIIENNYKQKEISVTLEYFDKNSAFQFNVNAGARIGGYNIWRFDQKPLNIYMRSKYGDDLISYKLFENKQIGEFKGLRLRNGGDNWAKSFLTDAMSESLLKGQMENGIQAFAPSIVFINGEYWGIHNIREKSDVQYFVSNFDVDPNNFDHIEYNFLPPDGRFGMQVIEGSLNEYQEFLNYAENNNLEIFEHYEFAASQMDIDNFIDFIIAELYVCNTSWKHNREWWRSGKEGAKWKWLLPDIDRGFNYSNISSNLIGSFISDYGLFNSLLKNEKFYNRFIQKFAAHLNSTFSSERVNSIVDSLSLILAPEIPGHVNRWASAGGISSVESWYSHLNDIKRFGNKRDEIVFEHLKSQFGLKGIINLEINNNDPGLSKILINNIPITNFENPLKFFADIPIEIKAVPRSGYKFIEWKDLSNSDSLEMELTSDTTLFPVFVKNLQLKLEQNISVSTTLKKGNTYYTEGDVNISPNTTLNIEEGVEIKMAEGASIYVNGKLIINGTLANPVDISGNKESGVKKWGAICFKNATDTCFLKYVNISGATNGNDPVKQKAAISSNNSNLVLEGLILKDVKFPIYAIYGSTILRNSSIKTDVTCDYINIKYGNGLVENNFFYGNKSPDTDAIDFDGVSNGKILGNRFYNFEGYNCDAIDIGEQSEDILISGNLIFNSKDKGISVGQQSSVIITLNVIVGCNNGVAVKDYSSALLDQNTFFYNDYSIAAFEKNYGNGGGYAKITNSLISGSKISPFLIDSLSSIKVSYSLSDTDILEGENNIFADPSFIDPFNYNLSISNYSAAVDTGDPLHKKDDDGSIADIGANYNFNIEDYPETVRKIFGNEIIINEIMYNDGKNYKSGDWIELYNNSLEKIDLGGWFITDADSTHKFIFPSETFIAPDEYLIFCQDKYSFNSVYPEANNFIGDFDFGLGTHDKIYLYGSGKDFISCISYTNSEPWPDNADGTGASLELINPLNITNSPLVWSSSKTEGGTPGKINSNFIPTSLTEKNKLPTEYSVYQNYPNPFNPSTVISYTIPSAGKVKISVYNILGELVRILVNTRQEAGFYKVEFNGSELASGIYLYRLQTGDFAETRKMILLK
ncbi:MAG: CotH kinase family protein [Melioribacteraceae bacterium]|nr:CotH kinase family protein [Melioribacteraceae bacterium]